MEENEREQNPPDENPVWSLFDQASTEHVSLGA
jgi:hypothetical protein